MRQHCLDVLSRIVPESTLGLFSSCGVSLHPQELARTDPRAAPSVAGVVGFHGKHISGTLIVATSFELVELTRAPKSERALSRERSADWIAIRDWAAELANQLLGRIKGRLFVFNVPLQANTPTALSGATLVSSMKRRRDLPPYVFSGRGELVWVYLDATIDPLLDLTETRHDDQASAKEGELILF